MQMNNHILRDFLKKRNAWGEFVFNTRKSSTTTPFYPFKENTKAKDIIDYAFYWCETPQGHDYWAKLHYEYRKLMEKYETSQK